LQVAYYFSTIIKLYFVSFVQFSCVCLVVKVFYRLTNFCSKSFLQCFC